jgi:hypothetical protein
LETISGRWNDLEQALHSSPPSRRFNATQYLFDLRTTSLFILTRSHWFAGDLDRAARDAERTIEEAERSDHPIALCRALSLTMPFYLWIDDLEQIEQNLLPEAYQHLGATFDRTAPATLRHLRSRDQVVAVRYKLQACGRVQVAADGHSRASVPWANWSRTSLLKLYGMQVSSIATA